METTGYTSSGHGYVSGQFESFATPTRSRTSPVTGGGFLGGALGLLDSMMFGQGQRDERVKSPQKRRDRAIYVEEPEESESDESESDDEELVYGNEDQSPRRPRSVLSRFKDKLKEGGKNAGGSSKQQQPSSNRSRAQAAPRRENDAGTAFVENYFSSDESDESDISSTSEEDEPLLEDLEEAVEHEQRARERAKRRYQRALNSAAEPAVLSSRLKDLKAQERVLELAERDLRKVRLRQQSAKPEPSSRPAAPRAESARATNFASDFQKRFGSPPSQAQPETVPRPAPQRRQSAFTTSFNIDIGFGGLGNTGPFGQHRAFDRVFTETNPLADFHSTLEDDFLSSFMSGNTRPQAIPRRSSTRPTGSSSQVPPRPQPQTRPSVSKPWTYPATGSPALYETYNSRWLALAANSLSIPFPTPKFTATSLSNLSTIPYVKASGWSEERVLQTNAQLFFLQALQLTPVFSEDDGIVGVNGSEEAKKKLLDMMKKERVRWHSDRLGRRNGGDEGVNETLQSDERCRAVFHGVCGLAEALGGRA